jgi:dihydroflavonol-4-reductase
MNLVTGGTGIVGSRILFDLLAQGQAVRAIFRDEQSKSGMARLFEHWEAGTGTRADQIQWIEGDILDIESLLVAMDGVQNVYHVAAMVSFHKKDHDRMMKVNSEGTSNVVNACLDGNIDKICFVSSVAAIGRSKPGEVIHEEIMWKNSPLNSQYAISKYSAERELWRGKEEGLNVCIVNPCIVVGPGNSPRSSMQIFHRAWKGIPFHPTGSNGFVGVGDVSKVCIKLMEKEIFGQRFVLCAENLHYRDFFSKVSTALGKTPTSKSISKKMLKIAWILDSILAGVGLRKATLTRESIKSATNNVSYLGGKITKHIDFAYTPIDEAINHTAQYFLASRK